MLDMDLRSRLEEREAELALVKLELLGASSESKQILAPAFQSINQHPHGAGWPRHRCDPVLVEREEN